MGPRTIDGDASVIFTYEDYLIRNPPSFNLHEVDLAIELEWKEAAYLEWKGMTAREKAPFLEKVLLKSPKEAKTGYRPWYTRCTTRGVHGRCRLMY
ncbi:hypothetical protein OROMI_032431 [Orobanche minor]